MKFTYQAGDSLHTIELVATGEGFRADVDGVETPVHVLDSRQGEFRLTVGGRHLVAYWAKDGTRRWVHVNGRIYALSVPVAARRARSETAHGHEAVLVSPMPGQVRGVEVAEGDAVEKGQTMLLLEAMKMEIRIQAPRAGRVLHLHVQSGQSVERDQRLAEIE